MRSKQPARPEPRRRGLGQPVTAPWIGWNDSARSDTGCQIRIAVPGSESWGGSPDPRLSLSKGRRFSALGQSARRPGEIIVPEVIVISAFGPEPSGGPSLTTFACALKEPSRSSDRGGSPRRDHGPNPSRPQVRACQGRRAFTTDSRGGLSQWHGGRLGRLDLMGWTGNHNRRTSPSAPSASARTPRRPVSPLDGAGIKLDRSPRRSCASTAAQALVGTLTDGSSQREERSGHRAAASRRAARASVERPAGTIETGAATAYDPIIGAAASPLDLQRRRHRDDRRRHRHRRRLQQPGPGRRLRPRQQGHRRLRFRRQHRQSHGHHLAARHGHRRLDRLRATPTIWASRPA